MFVAASPVASLVSGWAPERDRMPCRASVPLSALSITKARPFADRAFAASSPFASNYALAACVSTLCVTRRCWLSSSPAGKLVSSISSAIEMAASLSNSSFSFSSAWTAFVAAASAVSKTRRSSLPNTFLTKISLQLS